MVKDIHGKNLSVGNEVYFTNYNSHYIRKGRITDIDHKNVTISYDTSYGGDVTKMQLRFSSSRIVGI